MRAATLNSWLLVLLCMTPVGWAADYARSKDDTKTKSEISKLITQLGEGPIAQRSAASDRLIEIGRPAKSQLANAAQSNDLDIRLRSRHALRIIARREQDVARKSFLEGASLDAHVILPGWEQFAQIVSDDLASRRFYFEMLASQRDLLEAYQESAQKGKQAFHARLDSVPKPAHAQYWLAALLLIAADEKYFTKDDSLPPKGDVQHAFYAKTICHFPKDRDLGIPLTAEKTKIYLRRNIFCDVLEGEGANPIVRKLLSRWVTRGSFGNGYQKLAVASRWKLETELTMLLKKLLANKTIKHRKPMLLTSILYGEVYGDQVIELVEPLLYDSSVALSYLTPEVSKFPTEIQVRDLALGALIKLTHQDHKDYNLRLFNNESLACHFDDQAARDRALAKWYAWAAKKREQNPRRLSK